MCLLYQYPRTVGGLLGEVLLGRVSALLSGKGEIWIERDEGDIPCTVTVLLCL
jgi:hypothetical protein